MSNICKNICKWIAAMEPDNERCLDLKRASKDIATEIHPHYNEVFQRLDCSLSEDIWCATSRRNKMRPAKPWQDSEHFILSDRKCKCPWRQLRTARLELYLYGIISFIFDVEYLYNFSPVNSSNGARRRHSNRFLEQYKDIGNDIHSHYNQVFQQLNCFLSEDIWRATSSRNKMVQAKP